MATWTPMPPAPAVVARLAVCWLCLLPGLGCALWKPRDAALTSYEQTRRQINGQGIQQVSYEEDPPARDGWKWEDFYPENIGGTIRELTGNGPNRELAKESFREAQELFAQATQQRAAGGDAKALFLQAASKFDTAAKNWPDSALQQDALFLLGESYFFADHYWDAETAYEKLLKEYQHSRHIDVVQPRRFAIAQYWLDLYRNEPLAFYEMNLTDQTQPLRGQFGHAMRVFDRIRLDDPTGKLADDATLALANAYFAEGKFMRADEYYTDLRKNFPSSEHQFQAHFLGLKAKLMAYQGADYSATALKEAEKLLKQIRKQFPLETQQHREYLDREGARVRFLLAERDWLMGQRFDRRSEYGAAKHYYELLLQDYPDTPFAERAKQRLSDIEGLPSVPGQALPWLVALFPEEKEIRPILDSSSSSTIMR